MGNGIKCKYKRDREIFDMDPGNLNNPESKLLIMSLFVMISDTCFI